VKWILKWLLRLALLVVVLVVALVLAKDSILRVIAENHIRSQTGMEVKIGKLSAGFFSPVITIENLKLYNTADFGGTPFANIPELHIECDRLAFAQHKLRIKLARFNFAELDIVRNEAGQTNIFSLVPNAQTSGPNRGKSLQAALGDFRFEGIDVLNLSLGKLRFIDLKEPKNNRELLVNLDNQIFPKVTSEADLYGILFVLWLRSGANLPTADPETGKQITAKPEKNPAQAKAK
jgi:uncharacterized protein involved in outer membrane biogenesis